MNERPPLRLTGILFAFSLNLFLVTVALFAISENAAGGGLLVGLPLAGSVVAGFATTFYVGKRTAIHAALGGMLSAPVLALFVLPGNWSFAILAGAFCAVGGILAEFRQRR